MPDVLKTGESTEKGLGWVAKAWTAAQADLLRRLGVLGLDETTMVAVWVGVGPEKGHRSIIVSPDVGGGRSRSLL